MSRRILTVWDDRYCCEAAPLTSTTKQLAVVRRAERLGLISVRPSPRFDPLQAGEEIARVHSPAYVLAIMTGEPRALAESQGFTWSPALADSLLRIWVGHMDAVDLARRRCGLTSMVLHPVSGAHHACYDRGGGFCTFNYLVGAARGLVAEGFGPTLIIDTDAHYGNGTAAMTAEDVGVYHFDIAGGLPSSVEITHRGTWATVRSWREYFNALCLLPSYLDRVKPMLVQWQAGVDAYALDNIGGIEGVSMQALRQRDELIVRWLRERNIPTVVTLAGGYSADVEDLHLATIHAMVGTSPARRRSARRCFSDTANHVTNYHLL